MNFFLSRLNKRQRRWYVAIESKRIGRGGDSLLSQITGICSSTVSRGRKDLDYLIAANFSEQVLPLGGRPPIQKKYPNIREALEQLLADEIAGDPMNERRWIRSSTSHLAMRLNEQGYQISNMTVWRMLRKMGFSLRANEKKIKVESKGIGRDEQFKYIASQKQAYSDLGLPVISVDSKKKELIGHFKNNGRVWCRKAEEVYAHDFPSLAQCKAIPYGIYDVGNNKGYVFVGISADTPEFAVESISRWWKQEGRIVYPGAKQLLILADGGGSNGHRVRAWKQQLQEKLCDNLNLTVSVCHYPTGCSKWNPIEYRLFSQISINWAGKPLKSLDIMLGYIRGTSTQTGLEVKAYMHEGSYRTGQRVTKLEWEQLNIRQHTICPDWNYTVSPRPKHTN